MGNVIVIALVAGYCAYLIGKAYKDKKEGRHIGCAGCSGACGHCSGCAGNVGESVGKKD